MRGGEGGRWERRGGKIEFTLNLFPVHKIGTPPPVPKKKLLKETLLSLRHWHTLQSSLLKVGREKSSVWGEM